MSHLARQQQALLDALFAWPATDAIKNIAEYAIDTGARGLKAYQTNGSMLAERAMASVYPVVAQLLGEESFADLARAFWHAHPPQSGDIAGWGQSLGEFLGASEQLQSEPYLPDVAGIEWALHRCAIAADESPQLHTLALLTSSDPAQLRIRLAPGCSVHTSTWPIASILTAHLDQSPSLVEVGQLLRASVGESAVVWRAGLRPRVRVGVAGEADLLNALLSGQSLALALDTAPALQFDTWLPMAVQTGLLLSIQPTGPST